MYHILMKLMSLMRAIQRKGWNRNAKSVTFRAFHFVVTKHNARWGAQNCTACIAEGFPWLHNRFQSNNTITLDFMSKSVRICDMPTSFPKLDRALTSVLNSYLIRPNKLIRKLDSSNNKHLTGLIEPQSLSIYNQIFNQVISFLNKKSERQPFQSLRFSESILPKKVGCQIL